MRSLYVAICVVGLVTIAGALAQTHEPDTLSGAQQTGGALVALSGAAAPRWQLRVP